MGKTKELQAVWILNLDALTKVWIPVATGKVYEAHFFHGKS